uniref:Uncharacterized protein n=1 Tax=Sipha flava TaxID=143950 RepID=A0A2S2R8E6_9HEMI
MSSAYAKIVFCSRISIFYLAGRDLITFSKAKLKSTGESASPCLKPALTSKLSDSIFANFTLHFVSVLHSFISWISLVGISNSSSAVHSFLLIILSYACLKSTKQRCTPLPYFIVLF